MMKIRVTRAGLFGLACLMAAACSVNSSAHEQGSTGLPPNYDPAAAPARISEPASEAEVQERTAFDAKLAAQGEAFAQQLPPELERQLEDEYQAAQKYTDEENALRRVHEHTAVDFDALFDKIRNTMPPARGVLLSEYVAAAQRLDDATQRTRLLERLGSQELNNVR
jgi:hypothetical protein